jgi:DNA-binding MarR family transcriptional regulator
MKPNGRTVDEIAASTRIHPPYLEAILRDSERRGLVQRVDDRWSLTASAEARFGAALGEIAGEEHR